MTPSHRISSSSTPAFPQGSLRNARKAIVMAELQDIEISNAKAESEWLRKENQNLKNIIQQFKLLEMNQDDDETGIQETDRISGNAFQDRLDPAPDNPSSPPFSDYNFLMQSTQHNSDQDTVNPQSPTQFTLVKVPSKEVAKLLYQKGKQKPSRETSEMDYGDGIPTGVYSKSATKQAYEIPADFDSKDLDYGLSEGQTVTSDKVLQAWGIQQQWSDKLPQNIKKKEFLPLEESNSPYKPSKAIDGLTVEEEDEDEWEAINAPTSTFDSRPPAIPLIISLDAGHFVFNQTVAIKGGNSNIEAGDDTSTIHGGFQDQLLPHSLDGDQDDQDHEKASTVAETGSETTNDERWLILMKDFVQINPGVDLEKVRSDAEAEERETRDQEYKDAMAAKPVATEWNHHAPSPLSNSKVHIHKQEFETPLSEDILTGEYWSPPANKTPKQPTSATTNTDTISTLQPSVFASPTLKSKEPWLLDKFNEIFSTLSPGLTAGLTRPFVWNSSRQIITDENGRSMTQTRGYSSEHRPTPGDTNRQITESERILRSLSPEDGDMSRSGAGEGTALKNSAGPVDKNMQPELKVPILKNKYAVTINEPVRPVGRMKEEQSRRVVADKVQQANSSQKMKPTTFGSSHLEKSGGDEQSSTTKGLQTPHTTAPGLNDAALKFEIPVDTYRSSELVEDPQTASSSVETEGPMEYSEPITQSLMEMQITPTPPKDEPNRKKSIHFQGTSPTSNAKHKIDAKIPHSSLASSVQQLARKLSAKPLVSILKQDAQPISMVPRPKNKSHNYDYIREVCVRNLPKDITYSTLLNQVSGGLIEKATINWTSLEARIVFVEPEAACKFHSKIEQSGFWVHTELPHTQLLGKQGLIQCSLSGFLWTQNSAAMTPSMIEAIWNSRVSRCLIITNFPHGTTVGMLVKDIHRLFADIQVKETDILEIVSIQRNKQISATGFIALVKFTTITWAMKMSDELRKSMSEYGDVKISFDADPCGGLMGTEPPRVWMQGKALEKGEIKKSVSKVSQSLPVPRPPKPIARKSVGIHRGQSNFSKPGRSSEPFSRQPAHQYPQRPIRPAIALTRGQNSSVNAMTRANSQAARAIPSASANPNHLSGPSAQLQVAPNQPSVPQNIPQPPQPPPSGPLILQNTPQVLAVPRGATFRNTYDNWDDPPPPPKPRPEGAHWNHTGQKLVHEYQQSLVKKQPVDSDAEKALPILMKKAVRTELEPPYYDRLIYLANLPRNLKATQLLRAIRGGSVEHLKLQPPSSQYDSSKAILIFTHRDSARDYKKYLLSPGLSIEPGHRIACVENDFTDSRFNGIRLAPSQAISSEGLTRCLKIDMLPKGTTLDSFLHIIEEGMNHSALELEYATIEVSPSDKDMELVTLRMLTITRAVWVAGTLGKFYEGIKLSYDRDPCEGPLSELEAVNLRETD